MISVTKSFEIPAGHRLLGHPKCVNLHGHNYVFEVSFSGPLPANGMIIDFSVISTIVGGWLKENWDHTFFVHSSDKQLRRALDRLDSKVCVLQRPPTAEVLAAQLAEEVRYLLPIEKYPIDIESIVCRETSTSSATWRRVE